ncbi:MAG: superoxide dismutase [Candidatus Methanomethylicia archaeon]|nr:superoxide dismutase [Candidatus Methanomethylicia archaeon]
MYKPKNYDKLIGIRGLSEQLLRNHFALYQGYVTNTNKLLEILNNLLKEGKIGTPEYAEVKRRLGWEFNGMRLHEYYFENMTKDYVELDKNSKLYLKIVEDFGSYENWEREFKSTGVIRGIGWVILYYDKVVGKLLNVWVNEHDVGHLAGLTPILVMDVFEHAYMIDYGLRKAEYVEVFFKNINWSEVIERFNKVT